MPLVELHTECLMSTIISNLLYLPPDETCTIEANLSKSNVMTPEILTVTDIIDKSPQEWILLDVFKFEKIEVRSIRYAIKDIDGSHIIRINMVQSFCYNRLAA